MGIVVIPSDALGILSLMVNSRTYAFVAKFLFIRLGHVHWIIAIRV